MLTRREGDAAISRAGLWQYGPATIWISGSGGLWWATVRFGSQEKDLEAKSVDAAIEAAVEWIDAAPELAGVL